MSFKDFPAAYQATAGSPLEPDRPFYRRLVADGAARTLVERVDIPIRSARAWHVPAGHLFRLTAPEGPQVGDLNLWSALDGRERFWASRTRQLQAAHVTTFDRLWSNLPFLRPMATIVSDTLSSYGTDAYGGRVHDLLGTRCDPYVNRMLTGEDFHFHCHSNLTRAILPHGLTEFDVHDVLNVFQVTGLTSEGRYFMRDSPVQPDDHLEFFAEIDLLCALSACPGGDLSVPLWGPDARDPLDVCRPLRVEVFRLPDALLEGWHQPQRAAYRGNHGLTPPTAPWQAP